MKSTIIFGVIFYLSFGFIFAMYAYSYDLRTFVCDDTSAPHGYITMGTKSFENPDSDACTRRGLGLISIATIPTLTVLVIPLLIMRSINGNN